MKLDSAGQSRLTGGSHSKSLVKRGAARQNVPENGMISSNPTRLTKEKDSPQNSRK